MNDIAQLLWDLFGNIQHLLQGRLQQKSVNGFEFGWSQNMVSGRAWCAHVKAGVNPDRQGLTAAKLSSGVLELGGAAYLSGEVAHNFEDQKTRVDAMMSTGTLVW